MLYNSDLNTIPFSKFENLYTLHTKTNVKFKNLKIHSYLAWLIYKQFRNQLREIPSNRNETLSAVMHKKLLLIKGLDKEAVQTQVYVWWKCKKTITHEPKELQKILSPSDSSRWVLLKEYHEGYHCCKFVQPGQNWYIVPPHWDNNTHEPEGWGVIITLL